MTRSYNPKSPAWYSGGLDTVALQAGSNRGNVYYVNGTAWGDGDDTNSGLRPDDPFMTLTHAIDQCNDETFDTIVVVDIWQPTDETWPVAVDKRQVTIVGAPGGSYDRWPAINPTGNTAAFEIQAAGVRIIDFTILAGAAHAGIEFSGGCERVGIYGCSFWSGQRGVDSIVNGASFGLQVSDCYFMSALTAGGIRVVNMVRGRFSDNVFNRVGGVAIEITAVGGSSGSQILDNRIAMPSDTQGIGITLGAACTETIVDGNSAFWGETVNNSPYLDNAGANANSWGMNHHGNTHILPD